MTVQARLRENLAGEWLVAETRPGEHGPAGESLFALGNGYLGVRGTPDEGTPAHDPGAILNGLHETWPIVYPEDAFGLARTGQTIVNAPDGSIVRLFVDDEPFDIATARILRFERTLDMRAGVLRREVEFDTPRGRRMLVRSSRLVSLDDRHLMAIGYEVRALDADAAITLSSEIVTHHPDETADDPRRGKGFAEKVLVPLAAQAREARAVLHLATRNSGLEVACGVEHDVVAADGAAVEAAAAGDGAQVTVLADLGAGESLRLSKYVAYHWGARAAAGDLAARVGRTLDRAAADGYDLVARALGRGR
jgi:alpha,alpha-trehalose phosphorylase